LYKTTRNFTKLKEHLNEQLVTTKRKKTNLNLNIKIT